MTSFHAGPAGSRESSKRRNRPVRPMLRSALASAPRLAVREDGATVSPRAVPEETPVALSYAGTTHAVMMATPSDLEDFALGFSLTEGIISSADEIETVDVEELDLGIDMQIRLRDAANRRFEARRRRLAGPVGCGLCGIESIDEAIRAIPPIGKSSLTFMHADVTLAVKLLSQHQPLHAATGAVHAAGFYVPGDGIVAAREDVGRHNALDKLIGAVRDGRGGALLMTCRMSIDLVQKAAAAGFPVMIGASAPTAAAVDMADAAGITLIGLARDDRFEVFTHPRRIAPEESAHVA